MLKESYKKFGVLCASTLTALFVQAQEHDNNGYTDVRTDGSVSIGIRDSAGNYEHIYLAPDYDSNPPDHPQQQNRPGPEANKQPPAQPQLGPDGKPLDAQSAGKSGKTIVKQSEDGNIVSMKAPANMPENSHIKRLNEAETAQVKEEANQGPFYFVDEAPAQVIQTLEVLMGKSILLGQGLPIVKLNFVSKRKMTREDAINAISSLLSLNGIAIVPMDEKFNRATPIVGVNRQSPQFIFGDISKLPPSQAFYTKLFELEYIEVSSLQGKIKNLLSMDGTSATEIFPRSNAMLITDTLINLQRVDTLIKYLDKEVALSEVIEFIQIKKVSASDIREKLNNMNSDIMRKYFDKTVFDVDSRTNQLIVITQKGNIAQIKKFIEGLDVEAEPLLKNEVFLIRHCTAQEIESVLNNIITKQRQQLAQSAKNKRESASAAARDAAVKANAIRTANRNANVDIDVSGASASSGATGLEFSEYVNVVSHAASSSVVVYGTAADIAQLRKIVDRLDVPMDQVKIDVIITEVTLSDGQVSGLSSLGLSYGLPLVADGQTIGGEGLFSAKTNTDRVEDASNPAFSFGISENQFIASFDLARQNSNVKILSCPMIVTTHGQDAEISIEEQHPYITSAITDTANPTATRSTIDYMDVGINLKVKPFVGTDQVVRIEITQKVNSISRYTIIDSNPSPVVSQRMAKSIISVKNNEVIVLGGLQQTDIAETDGGVWLLSDIPLIGQLFRPSKATEKRRDLIMFVRPRIIMSQNVADTISDAMMEDSTVKREIENFLSRGRFYSDKEMEANKEEFESNRLYNKILEDPAAFIMQEKIVKEGSTKDIEAKRAKEKEDKEKAKIEAEKSAQNSEKSAPENPAENKD